MSETIKKSVQEDGGPDLVTLEDLLESTGVAKELEADELEWVVETMQPVFNEVAAKTLKEHITTRMDPDHSLQLWIDGVTQGWKQSDRARPLRDVLMTCVDFDKWGIEAEFNEFMRRCNYTASVRGHSPAVIIRMQKALIDFVAAVTAAKLQTA